MDLTPHFLYDVNEHAALSEWHVLYIETQHLAFGFWKATSPGVLGTRSKGSRVLP